MTKDKVTIQDIADSLGLSRTTVSKVLNGSANMPEKTVNIVLNKAREMNYKQFSCLQPVQTSNQKSTPAGGGHFALLVNVIPEHFHIASSIMTSLEQEISRHGYSLTVHMLTPGDIRSMLLPQNFKLEQVDAILGIEIFDRSFSDMLCSLGKPVLFFDSYFDAHGTQPAGTILLMESRRSVYKMVDSILQSNRISHAGFIGDFNHCISFHERYEGFCSALAAHRLPYEPEYCITHSDALFHDTGWLNAQLEQMVNLPELFCCANDLLAWKVISALRGRGIEVPKDILICGFDDTLVLNPLETTLTTITTPSSGMGVMAAQILLDRIGNPKLPSTSLYLHTEVQMRQSTVSGV